MKKQIQKAFSLFEMMVVLGIMGVLLTISVFYIRNYQQRYLAKNAADQIVVILRKAQSLALSPVKENDENKILGYQVTFNSTQNKITLYEIKEGNSSSEIQSYFLPKGVKLQEEISGCLSSDSSDSSGSSGVSIFPLFFSTPQYDPSVPYQRKTLFGAQGSCSSPFSRYIILKDSLNQCFSIEINCQTGKIELK